MLLSISLILIFAFLASGITQKFKLPGLLGMLLSGVALGPYGLDLISPEILGISSELREIALIILLLRAGLSLDIKDLKKVGRPAFLMCFVPATFELIATTVLAPVFFGISYIEAAILGAVLAAVSPAVVVPRMLKLMENGYGKSKGIPQLIMAGAAVDDIYVIVLFTSFLGMYQGGAFDALSLLKVPVSIVLGFLAGSCAGFIIIHLFRFVPVRLTVRLLITLSIAFLFVSLERAIKTYIPLSGLLAVMALGYSILRHDKALAGNLSNKLSKAWVGAEAFLFVLVGAEININYLKFAGIPALIIIMAALLIRICGVFFCLTKTNLSGKERIFCAISYLPKATVQASIGSIPLTAGVASGNIILTVAVLSIMITAPIGALGVDATYKQLLSKN